MNQFDLANYLINKKNLIKPTKATQRAKISPKNFQNAQTFPKKITSLRERGSGVVNRQKMENAKLYKPFSKTLDLSRGVLRLLTNYGDKDGNLVNLRQVIKEEMMNPTSMARLMRNFASYLEEQ